MARSLARGGEWLGGTQFRNAIIELAVPTAMVVALVASLLMLRKRDNAASGGASRVT